MTRISGYQVIRAPCCGARLTTTAFASLNFMANEHWTDGRAVGSLSPTDGGLRRCTCGSYFLLSQSESLELIRKKEPVRVVTRSLQIEAWLRRKSKETTTQAMERLFGVRQETAIEAIPIPIPPAAERVNDSELTQLLATNFTDRKLLITARRRYWRYLNDAYRDVYRAHKEHSPDTYPAYEPSTVQIDNMLRLILMLEEVPTSDSFEIVELHRELGEPEKALKVLSAIKDQTNVFARVSYELIALGNSGPARYRPNA